MDPDEKGDDYERVLTELGGAVKEAAASEEALEHAADRRRNERRSPVPDRRSGDRRDT